MILRRTILFGTLIGLCAAAAAWKAASTPAERIPATRLRIEQPYAVDVSFERSRLDLDLNEADRYLLILGSLSGSHRPRTVTLSAQPIATPSPLSAAPLAPLRQKPGFSKKPGFCDARRTTAGSPAAAEAGSPTRGFALHVTDGPLEDPRHYARLVGRLVASGREVEVYLDARQQRRELAAGLLEEVVGLLDDELIPAFRRQLGGFRDVDGNGKFTVLLSPWLSRLQGGKTSLGGFVRESDFRENVESPFGNCCDMMYLNSNLTPGSHLRTLLAHEFTHVVCFSRRLPSAARPDGLPDEEDWLNEAIAHVAENLNGGGWSNLDYRVSRFLAQPQDHPLVVADYYGAGLWRSHGCRGATYLFLRWCADRFGEELLGQLIDAPHRGRENLEYATGVGFDELFRRWTVSLFMSNRRRSSADVSSVFEVGHAPYLSLDLRGRLADWGLAGPRTLDWNLDGGPCSVQLAGTSAAFVSLGAATSTGPRRIQITGEFGTRLQVTLIRLPGDWPEFDVTSKWAGSASTSRGSEDEPARLHLSVAGSRQTDLRFISPSR